MKFLKINRPINNTSSDVRYRSHKLLQKIMTRICITSTISYYITSGMKRIVTAVQNAECVLQFAALNLMMNSLIITALRLYIMNLP